MSRFVILIPTYNESISIVELLNSLATIQNRYQFDVVVLDDNSPDGTADIALDLQFKAYTEPINISDFDIAVAVAADFGAGSGRWTERLKPYFKKIYALEPSIEAVGVLNSKFNDDTQIVILNESVERNSIPDSSLAVESSPAT